MDVKGVWTLFDGNLPHATLPYTGTRCGIRSVKYDAFGVFGTILRQLECINATILLGGGPARKLQTHRMLQLPLVHPNGRAVHAPADRSERAL